MLKKHLTEFTGCTWMRCFRSLASWYFPLSYILAPLPKSGPLSFCPSHFLSQMVPDRAIPYLLLFSLHVEPLAEHIRTNSLISRIIVWSVQHKTGLYAADVLLTLLDPIHSLLSFCSLLEYFGTHYISLITLNVILTCIFIAARLSIARHWKQPLSLDPVLVTYI